MPGLINLFDNHSENFFSKIEFANIPCNDLMKINGIVFSKEKFSKNAKL